MAESRFQMIWGSGIGEDKNSDDDDDDDDDDGEEEEEDDEDGAYDAADHHRFEFVLLSWNIGHFYPHVGDAVTRIVHSTSTER